jgi:hypothetical protein
MLECLQSLARGLSESAIDYAIAGDMASFAHGFRQYSDRIELIVNSPASVAPLADDGYTRASHNPGIWRDSESGVRIDFLFAGSRSLRNRPLPFAIPEPREITIRIAERPYLRVEWLLNLKLGPTLNREDAGVEAGVIWLMRAQRLPRTFADRLHSSVRLEYQRIWDVARVACPRMALPWKRAAIPRTFVTYETWLRRSDRSFLSWVRCVRLALNSIAT